MFCFIYTKDSKALAYILKPSAGDSKSTLLKEEQV